MFSTTLDWQSIYLQPIDIAYFGSLFGFFVQFL